MLAVVFAEVADGGIDSKALAMLGVLSAVNAGLRPLGAGTAGIETVFFMLIFAGRVFGPGFGFTLGCTSMFASAVITGGVGPWMPYQMFGCAWVGLFAGLLPPCRGQGRDRDARRVRRASPATSSASCSICSSGRSPSIRAARSRTCPAPRSSSQLHRYLLFDVTTSLGWDTGRAITNVICIVLIGPAALATFRRAARRASFRAPVSFRPGEEEPTLGATS